jgi:ubiquinone/menaquinone biosynthesis C-methylase UbiE
MGKAIGFTRLCHARDQEITIMNEKPIAAGRSSFDLVDAKRLFIELDLKEDRVFLDLGCGCGEYSIAASEYVGQGGRIYAVDLWEEGINSLQRQISNKGIKNIYPRVADISQRIPLEDHCIDVCLMATILHDLIQAETDKGTLREVVRVLRPYGMLAVIEFKKVEGSPGPPIGIRISPGEVERHLRPYSFRLTKNADIGKHNYLSIFRAQEKVRV